MQRKMVLSNRHPRPTMICNKALTPYMVFTDGVIMIKTGQGATIHTYTKLNRTRQRVGYYEGVVLVALAKSY